MKSAPSLASLRRACVAPHYPIFDVELSDGGRCAMLVDVSLAHVGMLFLEGLPKCRRYVFEALSQPLEKSITQI